MKKDIGKDMAKDTMMVKTDIADATRKRASVYILNAIHNFMDDHFPRYRRRIDAKADEYFAVEMAAAAEEETEKEQERHR